MAASNRFALFAGLAWLVAGCAVKPAPNPATTAPTIQPPAAAAAPASADTSRQCVLQTSMTPSRAAWAVAEVNSKQFSFSNLNGNGIYYLSEQVELSDFFFAKVETKTASVCQLTITCDWIADGHTEVTIGSDLPAPEFDVVIKAFQAALTPYPAPPPATQPATDPAR